MSARREGLRWVIRVARRLPGCSALTALRSSPRRSQAASGSSPSRRRPRRSAASGVAFGPRPMAAGPPAATRRPRPLRRGPRSRPGPAAWKLRHYCVDPPGASCLADVRHPQAMRGPRCCSGGCYIAVSSTPTHPSWRRAPLTMAEDWSAELQPRPRFAQAARAQTPAGHAPLGRSDDSSPTARSPLWWRTADDRGRGSVVSTSRA